LPPAHHCGICGPERAALRSIRLAGELQASFKRASSELQALSPASCSQLELVRLTPDFDLERRPIDRQ